MSSSQLSSVQGVGILELDSVASCWRPYLGMIKWFWTQNKNQKLVLGDSVFRELFTKLIITLLKLSLLVYISNTAFYKARNAIYLRNHCLNQTELDNLQILFLQILRILVEGLVYYSPT